MPIDKSMVEYVLRDERDRGLDLDVAAPWSHSYEWTPQTRRTNEYLVMDIS